MMKRIGVSQLVVLFLIALCTMTFAQSGQGDRISESSAGNFFGVGGRAVGMSEAVVVSVMDGTAIVYNPAGLARIKRPELFGALSHERVKNRTGFGGNVATSDFAKTRLNGLDLTVPVPTYRGSLVVAFGVNRTKSFDRTLTFQSGGGFAREEAVEEGSGGIREWSAAGAIELSPRLAVGTTLTYYRGKENYYWNYIYPGPNDAPVRNVDNTESRYSAVGARVGLIFEANPYVTFGFTVDAPTKYTIQWDYQRETFPPDSSDGLYNSEYHLTHPFIFNLGTAFRFKTMTLEADVGYADWSQLETDPQIMVDSTLSLNRAYQMYFSDAIQLRLGAEYVVPRYGIVLRGGFKHDPLPFSGVQLSNQIEKDRNSFSAGLGFLIDRIVMLDIAYARASYTLLDGERDVSSKYTSDRVLLSVGYRI